MQIIELKQFSDFNIFQCLYKFIMNQKNQYRKITVIAYLS